MLPPECLERIQIAFDDHRLVADAGLLLPVTLAHHLGLGQLVDRHVDLGRFPGRANAGDQMVTLVASALAGGDCIDDAHALRTGRTADAIGCVVKAPSTLGTFLRGFQWSHVRQLDRVSREMLARAWSAGAGPKGGSWWNALYFVLMLELFFTAATMSSGALEALVPELTRTAQDRMSVVSLIFLFAVVGVGLGFVMGRFFKDAYGIQVAGTVFALMALAFRYLSLRAVWNRAPRDTAPAQVRFWQGLTDTLRNSQFVAFLPTFVMFTTGVGLLQGWVPFFAVGVLLHDRDGAASSFLSMSVIAGVVAAGIVIWALFAAGRVTKRRIYGVYVVVSGLMFPLLGLVGMALPGGLLAQGPAFMFIAGMPMASVFLLPKGLTADIADYDALVTGERREAVFYATQNFFEKVTYALPPLLLSLVLQLGDSAEHPLGIRLAPLLAGALVLLGFALWPRYRLPDTVNRETVTAAGLLRPAV